MPKWLTETVTEVWHDLTPDEEKSVKRWIDQSERIIAQRFRTIDTRIEEGKLEAAIVGDVVEAMVSRALQTERRGGLEKLQYPEVGMEWNMDGGLGTGSRLYITTDELMLLAPPLPSGVSSVRFKPKPRLAE